MEKYDLVVMGTGPAGGTVAEKCSEAGWKVALIESREFGGNCALRGCNPKKVLVRAAEAIDFAKRSDGRLVSAGDIKIDWPQLIDFKNTFTDSVPENSRKKFDDLGIETFLASPRFVSPTEIQVEDRLLKPRQIVIATGARPAPLGIEGESFVTNSDEFLNLKRLPKKIIFIGGGYISFEFAHVVNRAGCEVTILERSDRPLSNFEPSIVDCLVDKSRELGINFHGGAVVKSVAKQGESLIVTYEHEGQTHELTADLVVHGAGRVPNLDDLDLRAGGIDFDTQQGILVDGFLRSKSNKIVHAAGDCAATDVPRLTPVANQDGFAVAKNLLGDAEQHPNYGPIPAVVFTIPSLASVGLTTEQAKKQDLDVRLSEGDMSDWGSVRKVCESHAAYKLLIDRETDQIRGAHLFGPAAAETINLFAMAIKFEIPANDLKSLLIAFPSFAADVRKMV